MVTSELTGQPIDTCSEQYRHECECRHVLGLPDLYARNDLLGLIAKRRGQDAADRIRIDVAVIFLLRQPEDQRKRYLDSFTNSQGFMFSEAVRIRSEGVLEARREATQWRGTGT